MKTKWKHLYHEDPYRRRTLLEVENWKIPEGDTNIWKLVLCMKNLQENEVDIIVIQVKMVKYEQIINSYEN